MVQDPYVATQSRITPTSTGRIVDPYPSPNTSTTQIAPKAGTNLGSGYGASSISDSSGKPLLTYENEAAKSSQLLSTRTTPPFDPTVAQKIDPAILQNGRMPESVSQAIKAQFPGSAAMELDHIMPLELGGSNQKSNLQLEAGADTTRPYSPGKNPTLTDPLENTLAKRVHNGEISLLDGWKLMAQAKGITLPEQGGVNPSDAQIQPNQQKPSALEATYPQASQVVKDIVKNPLALGNSFMDIISTPFNDIKQAINTFGQVTDNFWKGVFNHESLSKQVGNTLEMMATGGGAGFSGISTLFNTASKVPIVGSVIKSLFLLPAFSGDITGDSAAVAVQGANKVGLISDETAKNITPGIKDFASLVGSIYGGEELAKIYGELKVKYGTSEANNMVKNAQELVKDNPKPILENKTNENTPISKPTLSDIAEKQAIQPEKAEKPTTEESPLATEARKYKSAEEFVKAQGETVYHGTKANINSLSESDVLQYGKPNALYGQGLYLTDSPKVAEGYSVTKGTGEAGKILSGTIKPDVKLLNLDEPIKKEFVDSLQRASGDLSLDINSRDTGQSAMKKFMNSLHGLPTNEASEIIDSLHHNLEQLGYDGFQHVGGQITGGVPSKVSILWDGGARSAVDKVNSTSKSQLTDIWNKANTEVKPSEITQKVPQPRLLKPTKSSGIEKLIGSARSIFAYGKENGMDVGNVEDLPTYNEVSHKDMDVRITDMMKNDPERAERIGLGEEKAPKGDIAQRYYQAQVLKAKAEGNGELSLKLANSPLAAENTALGQKLGALRGVGSNDPVAMIKEINDAWKKVSEEKSSSIEKTAKEARTISERAKVARPKVNWNDFLETIKC